MKITKKLLKKIILEAMEEEFESDMTTSESGMRKQEIEDAIAEAEEEYLNFVRFSPSNLTREEMKYAFELAIQKGLTYNTPRESVDKELAEYALQLAMENDSDVPFAKHQLTPEANEWMRNAALGALGEGVNNSLQAVIEKVKSYDRSRAKAGTPMLPQPGDPDAPSPELMRALVKSPQLVRFLLPPGKFYSEIEPQVSDHGSYYKIEFTDRGGRGYVLMRTYAQPDGTPVTFGLARKRKGVPQISYAGVTKSRQK